MGAKSISSIVLIGMPGSGKSTLGVLLAKETLKSFVDTDIELQYSLQTSLQAYMNQYGHLALREREARCILSMRFSNCVISTGGSVVYSHNAMEHLCGQAICIYLRVPFEILCKRIDNFSSRGIAAEPGAKFADIFAERSALYEKYANLQFDVGSESVGQTLINLKAAIFHYSST